jgi:tRNA threonylcarbamoyladenosine modification (KEOPS) complex  Pcc1 subunit
MAHAATVTMDISGDVARSVAGALEVEAAAGLPRVAAVVRRQGGDGCGRGVTIGLTADDAASLRAALNSFLRWADLAAIVSQGAAAPRLAPAKMAKRKQNRGKRRARPARGPRRRAASHPGSRLGPSARPRSGSKPRKGTKRKR